MILCKYILVLYPCHFATFKLHFFPPQKKENIQPDLPKAPTKIPHLLHTFAQQSLLTIAEFKSFINAWRIQPLPKLSQVWMIPGNLGKP